MGNPLNRSPARVVTGSLAAALLVVGALSGCSNGGSPSASQSQGGGSGTGAQAGQTPSLSPSSSATPTPTPTTPAGPPALPANALFAISATVTAGNGATAHLYQVVYKPSAPDAADTALLNKQCNYPGQPDLKGQPNWQTQYANPLYLTSDLTATVSGFGPAWSNKTNPVLFGYLGVPAAFGGSYETWEAYCAAGFITVPGTIHAVAPVPASNPTTGSLGWAGALDNEFGFLGGGNFPGGPDLGGKAVVTDCVVQLSATASAASPKVAAWATQAFKLKNGCIFDA